MLLLSLQKVDPELIFTKQERIGKGSFGEVFKGVDNRTQQVRTSPSLLLMVHGVINYTSSCPITPPPLHRKKRCPIPMLQPLQTFSYCIDEEEEVDRFEPNYLAEELFLARK